MRKLKVRTSYKYIAKGEHKGHIVLVLKWGKGKVQVWCFDCREEFIGIKRCLRKIQVLNKGKK